MVKITTKHQFDLLVQQMELYPRIARGVRGFGDTKATVDETWKEISEKLNSCGPPMRTPEEWQRVWIHFKAKLKKKMANNHRNIYTTGGGPLEEISLSQIEQAAAKLVRTDISVNPQGNTCGVLQSEVVDKLPTSVQQEFDDLTKSREEKRPQAECKQQPPKKRARIEDKRFNLQQKQTDTQTEILGSLKKI
ncbi:hypothetical protein FF38_10751 [Lucilia cuprina]|uniref:Regulatory protein zeste n=1 Tax=Lucilia cuprina TaxID=7375 RepID=A0A0L0CKH6_LUCCU|nr:hypothetical protein FF38_10751 [Lucilia cuprina]